MAYFALGLATATKNRDGKIIEAFFPTPILAPSDALVAALAPIAGYQEGNQALDITAAQSAQLSPLINKPQAQHLLIKLPMPNSLSCWLF